MVLFCANLSKSTENITLKLPAEVSGENLNAVQRIQDIKILDHSCDFVEFELELQAENAGVIADSLYSIYDDGWLLKNLAQCQKDYYGLQFLQLTPQLDNAFDMVINYHVTDVFAFLCCYSPHLTPTTPAPPAPSMVMVLPAISIAASWRDLTRLSSGVSSALALNGMRGTRPQDAPSSTLC